jgi:hypothetical protein
MTHSMSIKPALQGLGSVPTGSGLWNCEVHNLRFAGAPRQLFPGSGYRHLPSPDGKSPEATSSHSIEFLDRPPWEALEKGSPMSV